MAKHIEKFAGLAAKFLTDFQQVEAQAFTQPDRLHGNVESEATIELILAEGDEETIARISVRCTHD
jgi:hypothetical protein